MKKRGVRRERLQKGVYILPNLFTSLNIFCGFYAIVASINGDFGIAAWAIVIAGVFDGLDGKIARATKTSSRFGIEYDSLADLVSFGMAPGIMMYLWALKPLGRIGWLAAFLFVVCGALRLARFNSQAGKTSSEFFTGLPIPAGAGMNAAVVLLCEKLSIGGDAYPWLVLVVLYSLSFLMVSTIKYHSLKKPMLFKKMNFNALVLVVLIMMFIAAQPAITLFFIGLIYVSSGPLLSARLFALKRSGKAAVPVDVDEEKSAT